VALVRHDQVERVDRDLLDFGVVIRFLIALVEHRTVPEQVDGHTLNGANVNERMAGLRVEQVVARQHLRVESLVLSEVLSLEPLAVHFIALVELEPRFRFERSERADSLNRQGPPIDQEQNPRANF
jgi:hypothetical protein